MVCSLAHGVGGGVWEDVFGNNSGLVGLTAENVFLNFLYAMKLQHRPATNPTGILVNVTALIACFMQHPYIEIDVNNCYQ